MSEIKFNIGLDRATRGCSALFLLLFKFSPGTLLFRIESVIYIYLSEIILAITIMGASYRPKVKMSAGHLVSTAHPLYIVKAPALGSFGKIFL